jgi:hypothetical protein
MAAVKKRPFDSALSVSICAAIVEIVRKLRRVNAETQRRRNNRAFSSAFLRDLCVSALRLV